MATDNWWEGDAIVNTGGTYKPAKGSSTSPQDRVAAAKYRDAADAADAVIRNAKDFESRDKRFGTGATKSAIFGAMYPDTDGVLGGLKAVGGTILRNTAGYLFPNSDHEDYQYLNSRASALNNAALRMEKGVQTKSDEVRIARENVGVDKTPGVNHDIIQSNLNTAAVAHARDASASRWLAQYGSLSGTTNDKGQTYDQWFNQEVAPQALAKVSPRPAPPSTRSPKSRVTIDIHGNPIR